MFGTPRGGILLATIVGALLTAYVMTTGTIAIARADDPFTDIVAAVQGAFALGQEAFTLANADFANGELADGLALFYGGVDDDLLSVPNNLLQGSLEKIAVSLGVQFNIPGVNLVQKSFDVSCFQNITVQRPAQVVIQYKLGR